ncbi:hypothetical protein N7519_004038 [Penicillium mononematosum]|uniref:uncharacterized protein n=1 Tax=Penicillium mononematosum TaxID=268346 RepID=UPI0025481254|nr:uncharacterized protein N7519_004038 [Penicillium mononematosum]KAJ6189130.1 hypothetical protein N7519_004038 [Penicillium mononematosum]
MTTYVLYSLDSAIDEFFNSSTTVTRQQCDAFAISRAGGVSTALQMQGVCSYTVIAGPNKSKLFQFRDENYTIDMDNIILAKAIHPDFVASCKYLDDMSRQCNTIKDFARFFAQSWNSDLQLSSDATMTLLKEFRSNFDLLARDLPSRFTPNLERIRKELPSLFSKALPFVLSHGDLNTMNLLINPQTGNITGLSTGPNQGSYHSALRYMGLRIS